MNKELVTTIWQVVLAALIPLVGGFISGISTSSSIKTWYVKLEKPSYNPPNWLFAPAWSVLYICIGVSSYLAWNACDKSFKRAALPLAFYVVQLLLNWAYTPIFFGAHEITAALIDIIALWATAAATGVLFFDVNKTAGLLFVPYMAWLSFATLLNYSILKLNPDYKALDKQQ